MRYIVRLDKAVIERGLTDSRSQAENYIKLGLVVVNKKVITKPGWNVSAGDKIKIIGDQYVSRAALKLASIAEQFGLNFKDKTVLDVGSSTGGFTDYTLQHGAKKVIAVDVGTDQLHPTLRGDERIELHEKTNIKDVRCKILDSRTEQGKTYISEIPDIVLVDVSFVSLRQILPYLSNLTSNVSSLIVMCKPQFEAGKDQINKGIIKNSAVRRRILKDFESWLQKNNFIILDKADSQVAGTKGNVERFYKLRVARG